MFVHAEKLQTCLHAYLFSSLKKAMFIYTRTLLFQLTNITPRCGVFVYIFHKLSYNIIHSYYNFINFTIGTCYIDVLTSAIDLHWRRRCCWMLQVFSSLIVFYILELEMDTQCIVEMEKQQTILQQYSEKMDR